MKQVPATLRFSVGAILGGLLLGIVLHLIALWLRDYGPSGSGFSFRGNGATIVIPVALIGIVLLEIQCIRRRAWIAAALAPLAVIAGLFVIFGSF
jgi:hypothetical protein